MCHCSSVLWNAIFYDDILSHQTSTSTSNQTNFRWLPDEFSKYLFYWKFVWESSSDNSTAYLNDNMILHHYTTIYLLWDTEINGE